MRGKSAVARQPRYCTTAKTRLRCHRRRRGKAELLQQDQPVKHQIERDMLAVAKAEHLDIVHRDGAARGWNIPHRTVENAVLRPRERAFLDRDVVDEVNGLDFDAGIRKGTDSAAEECNAGRFSFAVHPARRLENDVVGQDFRKPVKIMGIEGGCPLSESLTWGHCHSILLGNLQSAGRMVAPGTMLR
ncbi:hypothetical protein [Bradyrhizobium sp. 197]|uniref:hypothetical protein n=1 Tax=Bradyrhizobium sp. 197 TaxID=2782663 RepID=UPI001FF9E17C|nr:hypothetical protein [Bradyrhizobium sp. 197]